MVSSSALNYVAQLSIKAGELVYGALPFASIGLTLGLGRPLLGAVWYPQMLVTAGRRC
jgi:hypothetical protein